MGGRAGGGAGGGIGSGSRGLARSLAAREGAIRGNNFETLYALDANGNEIFKKIGNSHEVSYGMDGYKTKDAIVTHNHPGGSSFSHQDVAGMVYYNQKEMRATGKEYTFSLKRPENGWGVSWKTAQGAFKRANANARKAFQQQKTGNAASDRKLWISLTHQYNEKAAKRLGWDYSVKKNK